MLLGTSGCHLCDLAEEVLYRVQSLHPFRFIHADIIDRDDWIENYAEKIPVLLNGQGPALCWPFDDEAVIAYLKNLNA
ncbi:MAG: glutaredoxin family protein [Cellvibrio sp.]